MHTQTFTFLLVNCQASPSEVCGGTDIEHIEWHEWSPSMCVSERNHLHALCYPELCFKYIMIVILNSSLWTQLSGQPLPSVTDDDVGISLLIEENANGLLCVYF